MGSTAAQRLFVPVTFLSAGAVTIFIVNRAKLGLAAETLGYIQAWQYALLTLLVGVIFVGVIRRVRSRHLVEAFFNATVFLGIWFAFLHVIPLWSALGASSIFILAQLFIRRVAIHDLFYLLGCSGIALNLAGWLPAEVLVAGLVGFTVYDMVAGPPGGPIERLAASLVRFDIVPGFILPASSGDLGLPVDAALRSRAALLGAGDVILPISLVARTAFTDIPGAFLVLAGTVLGSLVLIRRPDLHPRSALAPLAVGTAIPFIILQIVSRL